MRAADPWMFEVGKAYWYHPDRAARTAVGDAGTGRYESWQLGSRCSAAARVAACIAVGRPSGPR